MLMNFPPVGLGVVLKGTDSAGNLINTDKLGMPYWFPVKGTRDATPRPTGKPIGAAMFRNTSGITLLPKRLSRLVRSAGYGTVNNVDGYASVYTEKGIVLIDPFLPASGVPDKDIFWGLFAGPAEVLLPLTGAGMNGDIVVGAPLVAATGTTSQGTGAGRVSNITGAATDAFNLMYGLVGRAMSARTTGETTSGNGVLVDLAINLGW